MQLNDLQDVVITESAGGLDMASLQAAHSGQKSQEQSLILSKPIRLILLPSARRLMGAGILLAHL